MPRVARRRNPENPHHVMCRSISEVTLFRNDSDKIKYLQLMALYCKKFKCSILAYCLMDTHVHIQLDPQGCDISKYMHGLNLCYAQYYNRKYKRRGPVFQGRFLSKVIDVDEHNLIVSAYIHNNPKNLPSYSDCVDTYCFSSYGIYLGKYHVDYGILNTNFILSQFSNNPDVTKTVYSDFVTSCNNVTQKQKQFEIIDSYTSKEHYEYRSERYIYYRDLTPRKVIETVAEVFNISTPDFIQIKYNHSVTSFKAISIFLMRCLRDYSYKDICKEVGNLTLLLIFVVEGLNLSYLNK
ncbi:transposase [Alkalibaculum sporogenes]|nr:transposase [Alkalibaculum sporogenes]